MQICIVGSGYVGLVSGAGFAEFGNRVVCADIDARKVALLNSGRLPIYEPGLDELVRRNVAEARLAFTADLSGAVARADVVFICVGTPPGPDGSADLSAVFSAARVIAEHARENTVVVMKSTVPVGTQDQLAEIVRAHAAGKRLGIASNPEFLREGSAVEDFLHPERVVVGTSSELARGRMKQLYAPIVRPDRLFFVDGRSAELAKYACNAMLATRISFMNEMARLCHRVGADVEHVRAAMATDSRIGPSFLYPGVGYGGSCFPKDIQALLATGRDHDVTLGILEAVEAVNEEQKRLLARWVLKHVQPHSAPSVALWGLAFKPNTDDIRKAPALEIVKQLVEEGISVRLHDPVAQEKFAQEVPPSRQVQYCATPYEAAKGVDALVLVTEWPTYGDPDFKRLKAEMRTPALFDGRNVWDADRVRRMGFDYVGVGRAARP